MNRIFLFAISCSLFISSCYYDSEEKLYPSSNCNTVNVSFANDVLPILTANCNLACHNAIANLGGITLETHADVLPYANFGNLVGSIKHASGFKEMPQGAPKMDACKISKIESWVQAGSPNN